MITIPASRLEEVISHARREAPNEVCGWLVGKDARITRVYPVPNVAEDPRREFRMDPEVQLSAMRDIREKGLELTGTYHSHPHTPPAPSGRDGALAHYPDAAHLIVSLAGREPEVRCYHITEKGFSPRDLNISPG